MDVRLPSRVEVALERAGEYGERVNEGFIVREVASGQKKNEWPDSHSPLSSTITPTASQHDNATTTTPAIPLMTIGKALLVLNHTHQDEFINSVVGDTESLARKAFLSLDRHLLLDSTQTTATTITISVLDQVVNKPQKGNEPLVLFWWIFMRHPYIFIRVMKDIIVGPESDKSTLLSICMAISYIVKKLQKMTTDDIGYNDSAPNIIAGFTEPIEKNDITKLTFISAATRLSVAAANSLISVFSCLPCGKSTNAPRVTTAKPTSTKKIVVISSDGESENNTGIQAGKQDLFFSHLDVLLGTLSFIKTWYQTSRPFLSAGLSEIVSCYKVLREDDTKSNLIEHSWKMMVPFLSLAPNKQYQKKAIINIQNIEKELQEPTNDGLLHFRVISVVLFGSTLSRKELLDMLKTMKLSFLPVLVNFIRTRQGHEIATTLLQHILFEEDISDMFTFVTKLLTPVLQDETSFNSTIVDLFAKTILWEGKWKQHYILENVILGFGLSPQTSRNMVDIIIRVLTQGRYENIKHLIENVLLENLSNTYLVEKLGAEDLYNQLDPGQFIPKLVRLIGSHQELRSAATLLLVNIVCRSEDALFCVKLLLDMCRFQNNGPLSPAQLGKEKLDPENILNLLSHIVEKLPQAFWVYGLSELVRSYLASPQDTVMVKFFVKISFFIGEHLDVVLPILVTTMQTQKGLSEEMLLSNTPRSEEIVKSLIFERLAPLLVLKVVPYTHFCVFWNQLSPSERPLLETTSDLLLARMTQTYEFEEVRRVSAQVLSYLPPVVWAATSTQKILSSLSRDDMYTAKICIFTWFNGLSIQGNNLEKHVNQIVPVILSILLLPRQTKEHEEVLKLQKGGVDCLAMMIKAAATRPEGQLNSSQHTTSSNPSFFQTHLDNFDDLLPFIIKISMPPFPLLSQFLSFSQSQVNEEQALQFRLRLVEGIATSIQACHDNGCQYIAKCTLQPLLTSLLAQNVPSLLVSSYFQVVIGLLSQLQATSLVFLDPILDFCFECLDTTKGKCMMGLKVLTIISTYDSTVLTRPIHGCSLASILLEDVRNYQTQNPEELQLINKLLGKMRIDSTGTNV